MGWKAIGEDAFVNVGGLLDDRERVSAQAQHPSSSAEESAVFMAASEEETIEHVVLG